MTGAIGEQEQGASKGGMVRTFFERSACRGQFEMKSVFASQREFEKFLPEQIPEMGKYLEQNP